MHDILARATSVFCLIALAEIGHYGRRQQPHATVHDVRPDLIAHVLQIIMTFIGAVIGEFKANRPR